MERTGALEKDQRTRALLQLGNTRAAAVQNPIDDLITRLGVIADVRHEFEGATRVRLTQHDGHSELRIVEVPAQLLPGAVEIDIDRGQWVREGEELVDLQGVAKEGAKPIPLVDGPEGRGSRQFIIGNDGLLTATRRLRA